jgi:hypothetical protein
MKELLLEKFPYENYSSETLQQADDVLATLCRGAFRPQRHQKCVFRGHRRLMAELHDERTPFMKRVLPSSKDRIAAVEEFVKQEHALHESRHADELYSGNAKRTLNAQDTVEQYLAGAVEYEAKAEVKNPKGLSRQKMMVKATADLPQEILNSEPVNMFRNTGKKILNMERMALLKKQSVKVHDSSPFKAKVSIVPKAESSPRIQRASTRATLQRMETRNKRLSEAADEIYDSDAEENYDKSRLTNSWALSQRVERTLPAIAKVRADPHIRSVVGFRQNMSNGGL